MPILHPRINTITCLYNLFIIFITVILIFILFNANFTIVLLQSLDIINYKYICQIAKGCFISWHKNTNAAGQGSAWIQLKIKAFDFRFPIIKA